MKKTIFWLVAGALLISSLAFAIDKKTFDGSEAVTPTKEIQDFTSKYISAINSKSVTRLTDLMHPASLKCYQSSKHPEYYQQEFKAWLEFKIISFKEIRRFKSTFDLSFYSSMGYPVMPTHVAIFGGESPMASGVGKGILSTDVVMENGRYYLAYRCM